MESNARIKVSKDIKPLPNIQSWKPIEFEVGKKYYVSFKTGYAVPCILIEIYMEGERQRLTIDYLGGKVTLSQEELGRTPEEAAINKFGHF